MAFFTKCRACGFEQVVTVYNNAINKKDIELVTDKTGKLPPVNEQCIRCKSVFYVSHENTYWRD